MIGYRGEGRGERTTLFPFGHGLGYSTWEYESIDVPGQRSAGVSDPRHRQGQKRRPRGVAARSCSYTRAAAKAVSSGQCRWLVGFTAVEADPGQHATATIIVPPRAFEHWSVQVRGWAVEPGAFQTLAAGPSSAVLPMSTRISGGVTAAGPGAQRSAVVAQSSSLLGLHPQLRRRQR